MATEIWRTRPYPFGPLSQSMDRLLDTAFAPVFHSGGNGGSGPGGASHESLPINVWETSDSFQAALLAPGLSEESLSVSVHEDTLTIEGDISFQVPEGAKPVWREFGEAKVRRSLRLSTAVDAARVEAMYKNGLLLITLPKAESTRPRQIPIRISSGEKAKMSSGEKPRAADPGKAIGATH